MGDKGRGNMRNNIEGIDLEEPDDVPTAEEVEINEIRRGDRKDDARLIPQESLTDEERIIVNAYLDGYIAPEDIPKLQQLLQRYTPAIMKYEPDVVLENLESNVQLVEDEKAFLQMVDSFDTIQVIPFTMYLGDKEFRMKFDLYPLTDSKAIESIAENLSLFKDFTEDELVTYNKIQSGEKLSREELAIRASLEEKVQRATMENQEKTIIEYLSMQLKFHNKDSSVEDMKETFKHFETTYLYLLFNEVQQRNHLTDLSVEKVFQEFD